MSVLKPCHGFHEFSHKSLTCKSQAFDLDQGSIRVNLWLKTRNAYYTVSFISSFNVVPNLITPSRIVSGDEYEKLIRIVLSLPPLG